jgi:phosphoglucomutase
MSIHVLAGKPAPQELLTNIPKLISNYYTRELDPNNPKHFISFGTSGHRGSSLTCSFNESHILAISQAICDYRKEKDYTGPLFLGKDTHGLSEAAFISAVEVFIGNNLTIYIDSDLGYTPTPVISHAILCYNKHRKTGLADGVIITPSHNPPEDGGIKYNPPTGGPADSVSTAIIQKKANQILKDNLKSVKRIPYEKALLSPLAHRYGYQKPYIEDLENIINMEAIQRADLKIGVDPLGGAGISFWEPIAEKYRLKIEVVNSRVDPTFSFMSVDRDGKIRMDCSSPFAMAGLINMKDRFDIAFGNDPDYDRHGIVTPTVGLLNPNHFLAVAVWYLFQNRPAWPGRTAVGKTLVSSSMIDRVTKFMGKKLSEVPVGFKWFVDGLLKGSYGFAGEESAGASFLRKDSTVWTTDKDGIIMDLLAAEITAVTGKDPSIHYKMLENQFGSPVYQRIDAPANLEQKKLLLELNPDMVATEELGGEKIIAKLTKAPGNNAAIGGLKVVTENGWFAARPSGTEDIYKIYAESFRGTNHLDAIKSEAQKIVQSVFKTAGF